jgi:uroporphyrinogen decarboxylase
MPDFNRLVTTLHHQEPDRVPLVEANVDYAIMSQFLGRPVTDDDLAGQVAFWTSAGYDYVPLTAGMMPPGGVNQYSQISRTIRDVVLWDTPDRDDEASWNLEQRAFILSEVDFEAFPWEEAARVDLRRFHRTGSLLPPGMKVVVMSGKVFTLGWLLMGFENFCASSVANPHFVQRVVNRVGQIQLDALRQVAALPYVGAVWIVDDLAFGSGPILRPAAFRRFIFPWYEELAAVCRAHSLYLFFHTDGVLWDLMEDLIGLGIQALHPIDPTCMDIEEAKGRIGGRVCLFGNIANDLLAEGTPEEVADLVKKRLATLAPGGGYGLGSGNSVPAWTRIENYRAMLNAALHYGRYPIRI